MTILRSLIVSVFAVSLSHAIPEPGERVSDFANLLSKADRAALTQSIETLERATTDELFVVTVPSLEGETVETYAEKLFNRWGIGKKDKNNGVLVLIAPSERKMRIEVGYGLEPILPDGLAGSLIREHFTPAFKAGDYAAGIRAGVAAVIERLEKNQPATLEEQVGEDEEFAGSAMPLWIGIPFFSLFVGIGFFMFGGGLASRSFGACGFGTFFGGMPLLMSLLAMHKIGFGVLLLLATVVAVKGYLVGRSQKGRLWFRGQDGAGTGWVMGGTRSSGGGSSGGSSSGGGGGRSGGGGASGSW